MKNIKFFLSTMLAIMFLLFFNNGISAQDSMVWTDHTHFEAVDQSSQVQPYTVLPSGNGSAIYTAGEFSGTMKILNTLVGTFDNANRIFVSQKNNFGEIEWVQTIGVGNATKNMKLHRVVNGIVLTGEFFDWISDGTNTYTVSNSEVGSFFAQYSTEGELEDFTVMRSTSVEEADIGILSGLIYGNSLILGVAIDHPGSQNFVRINYIDGTEDGPYSENADFMFMRFDLNTGKLVSGRKGNGSIDNMSIGVIDDKLIAMTHVFGSDLYLGQEHILNQLQYRDFACMFMDFDFNLQNTKVIPSTGIHNFKAKFIAEGVYVSGTATSAMSLTIDGVAIPGPIVVNDNKVAFVSRIDDIQGQPTVMWVRAMGGSGDNWAHGMDTNSFNGVVIIGRYTSGSFFDGAALPPVMGGYDLFVAAYDSDGNPDWIKTAHGPQWDIARDIDAVEGSFTVCGTFTESIDFGNETLEGAYADHGFTAVILLENITDVVDIPHTDVGVFPNPVRNGNNIYIQGLASGDSHEYSIFSYDGKIVQSGLVDDKIIIDQQLIPGFYVLSITENERILNKKIMITE